MMDLVFEERKRTMPPRRNIMQKTRPSYEQRRRQEALERQKKAREDRLNQAREIALAHFKQIQKKSPSKSPAKLAVQKLPQQFESGLKLEEDDAASGPSVECQLTPSPGERAQSFYSKQLMQPEWMTDVPEDLTKNWIVMPRPDGQRCLLSAVGALTVSRLRSGRVLHIFESALPCGSKRTAGPCEAFSLLDCIYHEPTETYYVMDVMCWRGMSLYECGAEFRMFWLRQKIDECHGLKCTGPGNKYRFDVVPTGPCTSEGLSNAVQGAVDFVRDGVYMLHKEAHYFPGASPLALLWKDQNSSQYLLDTDGNGQVSKYQHITLAYQDNGQMGTEDDPPVILTTVSAQFLEDHKKRLHPGKLIRFTIKEGGLNVSNGEVLGGDIHVESFANQRKGRADKLSKILFQYYARQGLIDFNELLGTVKEQEHEGGEMCG